MSMFEAVDHVISDEYEEKQQLSALQVNSSEKEQLTEAIAKQLIERMEMEKASTAAFTAEDTEAALPTAPEPERASGGLEERLGTIELELQRAAREAAEMKVMLQLLLAPTVRGASPSAMLMPGAKSPLWQSTQVAPQQCLQCACSPQPPLQIV